MSKILIIIILACLPWLSDKAYGGHLVGGEISYECLGDSTYVVTLQMYRDCDGNGAEFDEWVTIGVFGANNGSFKQTLSIPFSEVIDTLPFNQSIPCLVDTPMICISTTRYSDTFTLDVPSGGLSLVHQRCCRPPDVVNIQNVASIGSTYYIHIPDPVLAPCNSSPKFNEIPPTALCANVYLNLDYSATDKDSDSLVYAFCSPYHGGTPQDPAPVPSAPPFQKVPWKAAFNEPFQITALPALSIDSSTGIITGRPTDFGNYSFGVCVQEWRDGVFISENKRDFQLTTAYCEVDAAAAIDSALEECIGFDIQFYNQSTLGEGFHWDFGDSTTAIDTSASPDPIYTFPDTGVYNITLIAHGAVCSDTTEIEYRVQHKIEPFFELPKADCLDGHKYTFSPEGFYRPTTKMRWEFQGDTAKISDDLLPVATKVYANAGFHNVTLHFIDSELGCKKSYTDSVEVYPNPEATISESLGPLCAPYNVWSEVQTKHAYKPSYYWFIDSVEHSRLSYLDTVLFDPGVYDVAFRLITDSLCLDTVDIYAPNYILVKDTPIARIGMTNVSAGMFEPHFTVMDASIDAIRWNIFLNDDLMTSAREHAFSIEDTGNHEVSQVAIHHNGCTDTTSLTIRVEPEYLTYVPNAFTPDGDGNNDEWRPSVFVHDEYQLTIYDRWGEAIFSSNDPRQGWNGTRDNQGPSCPIGVYTYDIHIIDPDGYPHRYNSTLNLIR